MTEAEELVSFKPILGELPSPLSPPPGCHFHLRCPRAEAKCREIVPARHAMSAGRDVACHFPLEE